MKTSNLALLTISVIFALGGFFFIQIGMSFPSGSEEYLLSLLFAFMIYICAIAFMAVALKSHFNALEQQDKN